MDLIIIVTEPFQLHGSNIIVFQDQTTATACTAAISLCFKTKQLHTVMYIRVNVTIDVGFVSYIHSPHTC